jgi:hypothetical protein
MLSTRTYDEFIAQTQALCGTDFTSEEKANVTALANLAAKRAYKESQWWERFLVASEPRTATRGRVDASEDSYYVFGAGTEAANGLYVRLGLSDGVAAYSMYDSDGTTIIGSIWRDGSQWWMTGGAIGDYTLSYYFVDSASSDTPPESSQWEIEDGESPTPLLTDVADIDTYMLISSTDTIRDSSSRPIRFYVDSSGANLRTNDAPTTVWVTYKKTNTDIYGDGNSGTVADIPSEFFNYMSLYAAYMYQSSQRQNNQNAAYGLALREVENALQDELIRLEDQHITDNLAKNIYTHLSQNQSLI